LPAILGIGLRMNHDNGKNVSREDRLAAKLRENLRRRKAQARELDGNAGESGESGVSKPDGRG
jgi:hypothetical protein